MAGRTASGIVGVRKAVSTFNHWQGTALIYFDKANKQVECYTYTSPGSFENFHDRNIVLVTAKANANMAERDDQISMKLLVALCRDTYNA